MSSARPKTKRIAIALNPDRTGLMIWSGILRYAREKKCWNTISLATYQTAKSVDSFLAEVRKQPIDGLIVGNFLQSRILREVPNQQTVKIVTTEPQKSTDRFPSCTIDNAAIGEAAAKLLLRRGFTNFCYIQADAHLEKIHSDLRCEGFRNTLGAAGFTCSSLSFGSSLPATLSMLPKPLGIFVYNDRLAPLVINACAQANLAMPQEVGIVGVDNDVNICECLRPSLSSIAADFEVGGYEVARLLDDLLCGRKRGRPALFYGSATVVERDSTRDLKAGGLIVARATEIIRSRFREELTVEMIADQLNVSSVLLHRRFREILGQSVHSIISKARFDHAVWQLAQTARPVAEISRNSGFPCVEHFHRLFKKRFGISPKSWRSSQASTR